ncbi:MAG: error-prone DNA polymerase [Dermatophilaceae bacterium]
MGWDNPAMPWSELEARLSCRPHPLESEAPISRRRRRTRVEVHRPTEGVVPYAELHCHSSFSFLDGASGPDRLVHEAVRLGLHGLAITDHDGFYGAPLFAETAQAHAVPPPPGQPSPAAPPSTRSPIVEAPAAQPPSAPPPSPAPVGSHLRTVYGAELTLGLDRPQLGVADPAGTHLLVLARGVEGYHRLAAAMTEAHLRGDEKGRPDYRMDELVDLGRSHWMVLTGCRKGAVRGALAASGPEAAAHELDCLVDLFGRDSVVVELADHGHPGDSRDNDVLAALAAQRQLPVVATGNVHHATPSGHRLATAMAAVRARRSLADMDGWLPSSGMRHLRSGAEMAARFARYPGAVARSVEIADDIAFDLRAASPRLPKNGIPNGHTPDSWLRVLVKREFPQVYGGGPLEALARARVDHELGVIERKDFAGYFVIVHGIVAFARGRGILCQGRGSAASSAVCHVLGITAIDPVFYRLPFERFISAHRDEEPDIDVDFDSDRREEVIQWVYETYGRRNAAQVANVIAYRPKSAVRDAAKALGYSPGQQDAWSKQAAGHYQWPPGHSSHDAPVPESTSNSSGGEATVARAAEANTRPAQPDGSGDRGDPDDVPPAVHALAGEFLSAPRHLGIHSGGMVLTERPIGEVVPIERARMEKRTVLQWDKDACEYMGLVKFDLLGLGMLSALDQMMRMTATHLGESWMLSTIPKEEPAVYDMLCRADSVGVFQVESRAQIGTLPRLQPRAFYDLAVEIALIRPGPIQGGAVHPYVRRATGREPVTYPHHELEPVLARTLGVPLFQEQLMEMARTIGDCTADESDLLRRAMGSKRGIERIESIKSKLYAGMQRRGLVGADADAIYRQILSFANFGFAESHALSFALLVYASSWFKLHYPAAFLAALLRSQPMGFYSPQSLVGDARRHGVTVLRPDVLRSAAQADLEPVEVQPDSMTARPGGMTPGHEPDGTAPGHEPGGMTPRREPRRAASMGWPSGAVVPRATGMDACLRDHTERTRFAPGTPDPTPEHRRDTAFAVRLGLDSVRGIGTAVAERIVQARAERPFTDLTDLSRRATLDAGHLEALATAGAFDSAGLTRREALWNAGWTESADQLEGIRMGSAPPMLPDLDDIEITMADLWATGMTPERHPFSHLRERLRRNGIRSVQELAGAEPGRRLTVAGLITHRQRPGTASGITFLNLEDETGMLNVICSVGVWRRHRRAASTAAGVVIRGVLERRDGVTNLIADRITHLDGVHPDAGPALRARHRSRDFH